MLPGKVLLFGHFIPFELFTTIIGFAWTAMVLIILLTEQGRQLITSYKVLVVCFIFLSGALARVFSDIRIVEQMADGLKVLDTRLSYDSADLLAFGAALGAAGRETYAGFQYGIDTWAPPAFASFVSAAAFTALPREKALKVRSLILAYLGCAVAANALVPVVMLNFEFISEPFVAGLVRLVPWLDFLKYLCHISAWLLIVFFWAVRGNKKTAEMKA